MLYRVYLIQLSHIFECKFTIYCISQLRPHFESASRILKKCAECVRTANAAANAGAAAQDSHHWKNR